MEWRNSEPTVAVVIPAYNRGQLLPAAIDSALNQTMPPDEIIVVDDGSTDDTAEVVRRYGPPVRLIQIENTGIGPSRPRNVGIAAAASEYIMLLDSDDVLLPALLERSKGLMRQDQGIGLVFNISFFVKRGDVNNAAMQQRTFEEVLEPYRKRQVGPDAFLVPSPDAFSAYCRGNYIRTTGALFPKRVWDQVGGFAEIVALKGSEDADFFFRIVRCHDVGYISTPLHVYYHHDSNLSGANIQQDFRPYVFLNQIHVLERQVDLVTLPADRAAMRARLADLLYNLAFGYREAGHYGKALGRYFEAFGYGRSVHQLVLPLLKLPAAIALHACKRTLMTRR